MRSRALVPSCLAVAALLLAAACGKSDNGPSFASSVDSTMVENTASNADVFLSNTLFGVYDAQGIGAPYPQFAAAIGAGPLDPVQQGVAMLEHFRVLTSFAPDPSGRPALAPLTAPRRAAMDCVPTVTGVDSLGYAIDVDADGVPDDLTVDFGGACSTLDSIFLYTWSGSYHIQDTDSGFASYAFTARNFKAVKSYPPTGEFQVRAVNGTESASFLATGASHRMGISFLTGEQLNSDTSFVTFKEAEISNFTPTGGALAVGAPLPAGDFEFSSDFQALGDRSGGKVPGNFHFLFDTPATLTYDPACGSGITSGTFRGLLNGNSSIGFQAVWSGCGAATLSLFGITS